MASAAAAGPRKRVRGERNPVHAQRQAYIDSHVVATIDAPQEAVYAIQDVHVIFSRTIRDYLALVDALEHRDEGRVTAVCDALEAAKHLALASFLLPHATPREPEAEPQKK